MDIKSPPAVCASVVYDTARRQWVPKVKLIYDGKECSVECGPSQRVCVCTGPSKIEIAGEEVSDKEAARVLGEQWEKVEEHRRKVDELLQIADEMQTAFTVCSEEEVSDKEDDKEDNTDDDSSENTASRPSSPTVQSPERQREPCPAAGSAGSTAGAAAGAASPVVDPQSERKQTLTKRISRRRGLV